MNSGRAAERLCCSGDREPGKRDMGGEGGAGGGGQDARVTDGERVGRRGSGGKLEGNPWGLMGSLQSKPAFNPRRSRNTTSVRGDSLSLAFSVRARRASRTVIAVSEESIDVFGSRISLS